MNRINLNRNYWNYNDIRKIFMGKDNQTYTTSLITSKDGTIIGYRQLGHGPGIILVHGGMGASQHFMNLASALSDMFTLYIPDRRGRGLSGPFGQNYSIKKEIEDLEALIKKTGTHNVFGLSAGALITLQAALKLPSINKAALYEPPLAIDNSMQDKFKHIMQRFDQEIAEDKLADAFVTIMKGLEMTPTILRFIPNFLLVQIFKLALKEDANTVKDDEVPLRELIPTQHFDYQLVIETEGTIKNFKMLSTDVLLLGGSKSPLYLKNTLKKLNQVLPHAKLVIFPGLGHDAPTNKKKQERIVQELRKFFY
jgi:pimeloyl-ACP methyl ester carboxylesterase